MKATNWWGRRVECTRALMAGTYANGCGRLERLEPRLAAALGDLLARPGSLVRAVVAYAVSLEMGLREERARALACGLEYLHTASLVFDDLPAMDDARLRRGAVCLHVTHGEGVAMLAALALINRGYALLWQGIGGIGPARRAAARALVEECLGVDGVTGGQAMDLRGWRGVVDPAGVTEVAVRKTAALLRLCLALPAVAGRGTAREVQLLDRLAVLRGIAYQLADDLKDSFSGEEQSGKSAGRDAVLGRPNIVEVEGPAAALRRLARINRLAARLEGRLPGPAGRWGVLALLRVEAPPVRSIAAAS
jgi:geranylgeranyl pyrophosphate synthase